MRCRTARRSLLAARDGELAPVEREALDAHVGACETCRALAGETARLHRALAAMPQRADVPSGLAEATLRRVRAEVADADAPRGAWWWMAAPLAAGLAGVVIWHTWPAAVIPPQRPATASRKTEPAPAAPNQVASKAAPAPAASGPAEAEPPPQVAQSLDLYLDMPILENMEKLQNYDAIRTVDVGEGENGGDGRG
jgi:putative zinc finger protein